MTTARVLGALLIALPFLALLTLTVRELGWFAALVIFGSVAIVIVIVFAGVFLLTGSLR